MTSGSMIITIDGPAGVGKTTISRSIAETLKLAYLDSGAMFRALAMTLGPGAWDWPNTRLREAFKTISFCLDGVGRETSLLLNREAVSEAIRTEQVGSWASNLGKIPLIREELKRAQQRLGQEKNLVAEGRDMGTAVFPEAPFKFFLEADPEERGRRRWLQLKALEPATDLKQILQEMHKRDQQDRTRSLAPLRPAPDAYIIETTFLSQEQVSERILLQLH